MNSEDSTLCTVFVVCIPFKLIRYSQGQSGIPRPRLLLRLGCPLSGASSDLERKQIIQDRGSQCYVSEKTTGSTDHPVPIYEAATAQSSSLFRWRGYWMSVSKTTAGLTHYDADASGGGTSGDGGALILAVYTRRRDVLDEFVAAAREFYIDTGVLPRKQYNVKMEPSDSLLTAYFEQSDLTYDWMLEYPRSFDVLTDVMDYHISLKQSHLGWGTGPRDAVRFLPAPDSMQRFLFKSPRTGRSTWVQVVIHTGVESWSDSSRMIGGSIYLTLHSSNKEVLVDLINCAKQRYLEHGTSRVIVHLTSNNGQWAKTVTKSRRDLSTLILPSDIKETILTDAQEFLASEKWYNMAGIPHRRGKCLYCAGVCYEYGRSASSSWKSASEG
ncbi:hypothetical protein R3P38DRAFT_1105839 [Favolaschia claudopus]|uniref:BCS1 N-terminal domain-containing protein n=1 Tax=Favolaschia claudopus TaxID=2862362 RepID=A0AAW0BC12_9AGAR